MQYDHNAKAFNFSGDLFEDFERLFKIQTKDSELECCTNLSIYVFLIPCSDSVKLKTNLARYFIKIYKCSVYLKSLSNLKLIKKMLQQCMNKCIEFSPVMAAKRDTLLMRKD